MRYRDGEKRGQKTGAGPDGCRSRPTPFGKIAFKDALSRPSLRFEDLIDRAEILVRQAFLFRLPARFVRCGGREERQVEPVAQAIASRMSFCMCFTGKAAVQLPREIRFPFMRNMRLPAAPACSGRSSAGSGQPCLIPAEQ